LRPEPLDRPRPERAGAGEQHLRHRGRRAAGAIRLRRERAGAAVVAPRADQLRLGGRPREEALCDRTSLETGLGGGALWHTALLRATYLTSKSESRFLLK